MSEELTITEIGFEPQATSPTCVPRDDTKEDSHTEATEEESEHTDHVANINQENPAEKTTTTDKEQSVLDMVAEQLTDDGWRFSVDRDRNVVHTSATGKNGTYRIFVDSKPELSVLIVYVVIPTTVPEDKRLQVAEYIVSSCQPS